MSGHLGNLSPKQEAALKDFRNNIKDVLKPSDDNDANLLRWLRARSFDMKKSEKMFRDSMAWRKEFGADNILEWEPPEVIKKFYPGGYVGDCKKGYPVWIDTLGTIDLKGMFYSIKPMDVFKYKVYYMEVLYKRRMPENSKKYGRQIDQSQLIFDMEGIGMKHLWKPAPVIFPLCYSIAKPFLSEDTRNKIQILGTPAIFPIAYNLAKPFLSEDTKKKIQVMGSNWREELLKHIDADQLPVHWGGTMTGPGGDKYCKDKVCMGGTVPESYFAKNQLNFVDMENFTKATISKGSSLQVDFEIQKAGNGLRWQFWTEGMDIGFGLFRKTAKGKQKASEMEELVASERVNSHIIPEDGSYTCTVAGTYVIRFDNTYSYLNSKKVSYLVEILEQDETLSTQL